MVDKVTQLLVNVVQDLRRERADHEAEIRNIDTLLAAFKMYSPTTPTDHMLRAERNQKAKDFWAKRKAKRK